MLLPLERLGAIEDLTLDLRWDALTLREQVLRRAAILFGNGVGRGSMVAIVHGNGAHFLADLLAAWQIGATVACLDSALTAPELETLVRFIQPAALLTGNLPGGTGWNLATAMPVAAPKTWTGFELGDPALVLFTSGTTGSPKGVVISYRALLTRLRLNAEIIGEATLARTLVTLPLHFGHGLIGNTLTPLFAGGSVILPSRGLRLAQDLGRTIDQQGITFMSSVPALWQLAVRIGPSPQRDSLVRVHVGSAPLTTGLWHAIVAWSDAEVVNCYGITEVANWFAGASSRADGIAQGLVGRSWGGDAGVLDETGAICKAGEGEIVLQSPCLMQGYLHRPDWTAMAQYDGWYRTGDRGVIDDLGQIQLLGRIKDEINRAGFKIQPTEIDELLETHPSVAEACVFGVTDSATGEAVAAAIRFKSGASESSDSLRTWCRQRLRREAVPEQWFIVDHIPRNLAGKVSRELIRRTLVEGAPDAIN